MSGFPLPEITTVGQIGKISSEVTPKETFTPSAATQANIQAGENTQGIYRAEMTAANIHAQEGHENVQRGQEMMLPFQRIQQAKELASANDLLVDARLEAQHQTAALQTGDTPHDQWVPKANEAIAKIGNDAIAKARAISPAAEEAVTRGAAQMRLDNMGQIQGAALKRTIEDTRAKEEKAELDAKQRIFQTENTDERQVLINEQLHRYDLRVAIHELDPSKAVEKKRQLLNWYDDSRIVEVAKKDGLEKAYEMADTLHDRRSPEEILGLKQKAVEEVRSQNAVTEADEKRRKRQLELEQGAMEVEFHSKVYTMNAGERDALRIALPDMVRKGKLDQAQADKLLTKIEELNTGHNKEVKSDTDGKLRIQYLEQITKNPQSISVAEISGNPNISPETQQFLIGQIKAAKDTRHFTNNEYYKNKIKELEALKLAPVTTFTPGISEEDKKLVTQGLKTARETAFDNQVREAVTQFYTEMYGASPYESGSKTDHSGIYTTDKELRDTADAVTRRLKEKLLATQSVPVTPTTGSGVGGRPSLFDKAPAATPPATTTPPIAPPKPDILNQPLPQQP